MEKDKGLVSLAANSGAERDNHIAAFGGDCRRHVLVVRLPHVRPMEDEGMQKYTLEEVITRLEDRVPGEPISHLGLAAVAHLRDQVTRIAFLKRELNQLSQQWDVLHEHTDELEAASAAKDARIADLEAALAPFLRDQFEPGQFYSDAYHMLVSVRLGDIRRARAAVAAKPDPNYTTPRRPTDTVAMKPKEAGQ